MSTKIYNGYKIKSTDFNVVFDLILSTGKKCREWADISYKQLIISKCIHKLDAIQFNPNEKKFELEAYCNSIYSTFASIMDTAVRVARKSPERHPLVDYTCEFAIIPLKDKDYTLCIIYAEQPEYKKFLSESPLVEYYGYWNNTDQDEDCSEEEWKQREIDWDILGYEPVCQTSFGYKVMGDYTFPPLLPSNELTQSEVDVANDRDVRANVIFNNFIGFKYFSENIYVETEESKKWQFGKYHDYIDWLRDDDGIKYKYCAISTIKDSLKRYTVEDLTKNIRDTL